MAGKISNSDVTITAAESSHLPQLLNIYNHWVARSTATFHLEPETLSAFSDVWSLIVHEQGLPYIVAIDKGASHVPTVLGYAYAKSYHARPAYAATVEITVYLSPAATGRGIGLLLMRRLLDYLRAVPKTEGRSHGVREVLAVVADDPRHPMSLGTFYAKQGFEKVGTFRRMGWKFERWIDVDFWQMSLAE